MGTVPAVGSEIGSIEKKISMETMRGYSGEAGIHAQDDAGEEHGLGRALVQGGQLVAYLNQMMISTFGEGYLRGGDIAVTFIKPVRSGDTVTARGVVQEMQPDGTRIRVMCEVWLENQHGEKTTVGTASVPTMGGPQESQG
jgi:acyl dehydratase